jgi:hypothetical protein
VAKVDQQEYVIRNYTRGDFPNGTGFRKALHREHDVSERYLWKMRLLEAGNQLLYFCANPKMIGLCGRAAEATFHRQTNRTWAVQKTYDFERDIIDDSAIGR